MADGGVHPSAGQGAVAWFHCFSGIAGDMAFGALLDAGADLDETLRLLQRLPIRGWRVENTPVLRAGLAATRLIVHAPETAVVRTYAHIVALIEEARFPERLRSRALSTFRGLAEVEGRIHRRPTEHVHFHEVGAIDSIIDIVGTCAALEVLDVGAVASSPVATGMGVVRSAHGLLPNPSPAVVALLHAAPTYGVDTTLELTTPTGAALLAANVSQWGPLPEMVITATGYGAGGRDTDGRPNVTQVVLGTADLSVPIAPRATPLAGQPIVLLETNVDDVTGEVLAATINALLDAGAHDAWLTPIVMKKGRPAYVVSALADVALLDRLRAVMTAETGSLGTRATLLERWPSARSFARVEVDGHLVRVKVSPGRVKVEHDDALNVAHRTDRPVREVISLAEEAWRRGAGDPEPAS